MPRIRWRDRVTVLEAHVRRWEGLAVKYLPVAEIHETRAMALVSLRQSSCTEEFRLIEAMMDRLDKVLERVIA